ncbi:ribonuclease domain-containing protein [Noviherbaspirillum pedocola]|uniref:Ribonuclease n=1 Tax=Noviherbaspirillum pedocola TaxID=2801341 RepID=A0A934W9S0_9BURK|nr:ribonuclease domain-containing protein [Noviherbaspirillum pedocola]MBK4737484.1 ribonuclease [Noviherbaspirillum pedocola]
MDAHIVKRVLAVLLTWLLCSVALARENTRLPGVDINALPFEAQRTVKLIKQGGPYPYPKDGAIFGNYERLLPERKRGYYREFTVETRGERGRGARRIITGGDPAAPTEYYYTDDHYASFRRIRE